MNNKSKEASVLIGFSSVLPIVFIVLKLTGHIQWSWIWVLYPLWTWLVFGLIPFVIIIGSDVIKNKKKMKKKG